MFESLSLFSLNLSEFFCSYRTFSVCLCGSLADICCLMLTEFDIWEVWLWGIGSLDGTSQITHGSEKFSIYTFSVSTAKCWSYLMLFQIYEWYLSWVNRQNLPPFLSRTQRRVIWGDCQVVPASWPQMSLCKPLTLIKEQPLSWPQMSLRKPFTLISQLRFPAHNGWAPFTPCCVLGHPSSRRCPVTL